MTPDNHPARVERDGIWQPQLAPFIAVASGAWLWAIDLAGVVDHATLGVSAWLLAVLLGPLLLPWLTLVHSAHESPVSSLSRSIERWSRAGVIAWVGRGWLVGAAFGAPCLLILVFGDPAVLALPLALGAMSGVLVRTRRWWWTSAYAATRVWTMPCVTILAITGPLLVSMLVSAPMWRVDRTRPIPPHATESLGYRVDLEDAALFAVGVTITRDEEHELVRAPLGIFSQVTMERGRARLVSAYDHGDYVVPLSAEGQRLDDDPLSRIFARLDLGGGLPLASIAVVVSLVSLVGLLRAPSDLRRFAWLGLTTTAFLSIVWGF